MRAEFLGLGRRTTCIATEPRWRRHRRRMDIWSLGVVALEVLTGAAHATPSPVLHEVSARRRGKR